MKTKLSLRGILSTEGVVVGRSHGSTSVTSVLLLNRSSFFSGSDSVDDHSEGDGEEKPVNDSEGKSSVDGVAFTRVRVSTAGSNALCVLSDVDCEGDPDGEEHSPVDEFKSEGDVLVGERAVDHSGGHDPDEREESPGTLEQTVSISFWMRWGSSDRGTYSSNGKSDFFPAGDLVKSVCRERHDQDGEDQLGKAERETP